MILLILSRHSPVTMPTLQHLFSGKVHTHTHTHTNTHCELHKGTVPMGDQLDVSRSLELSPHSHHTSFSVLSCFSRFFFLLLLLCGRESGDCGGDLFSAVSAGPASGIAAAVAPRPRQCVPFECSPGRMSPRAGRDAGDGPALWGITGNKAPGSQV